jgi:hypothetical protein
MSCWSGNGKYNVLPLRKAMVKLKLIDKLVSGGDEALRNM